jgi:hypothetical protein
MTALPSKKPVVQTEIPRRSIVGGTDANVGCCDKEF